MGRNAKMGGVLGGKLSRLELEQEGREFYLQNRVIKGMALNYSPSLG